MARVVKKTKKDKKQKSKKIPIIIGSVVGGIALIGLIVFSIFYFQENSVTRLYKNSRDMDYETLLEIVDDSSVREKYEGTMYILVFNSDLEANPDYKLSDKANNGVKTNISKDLKLTGYYRNHGVEMANRYGFYAIDLMDEENAAILEDTKLGHSSGKPYIITIEGTSAPKKTTSISTYCDSIGDKLDVHINRYQS